MSKDRKRNIREDSRGWKTMEFIMVLLMIAGLLAVSRTIRESAMSGIVEVKEIQVVIDPGHGGKDPGKVGINDELEKDLNLQIGLKVCELLEKKGIYVTMTRREDQMLASEDSTNKKAEDMKARVDMINESGAALAVSIHQNSFSESSISGAQVFYYTQSQDSEKIAKIMQEELKKIDLDNTRQAKANDSYYLLKHTKIPTVIVECGFLSNPVEAKKLMTEEYQEKIAEAIVKGILNVV